MNRKIAIIIGAGPAGLTAAYELLAKTDIKPVIYELSDQIGGICRTVNYKGNRMDIGGHRFFSKSDRVLEWWQNILPLEKAKENAGGSQEITYQNKKATVLYSAEGPDPEKTDRVMLVRKRRSRIFYLRKFFHYPISLNLHTLMNLGWKRSFRIFLSYLRTRFYPIKLENSLRDFLVNRFGKELYFTFFRSYTQKVWGVPPGRIKAEWGKQRIKGLSLSKAIASQIKSIVSKDTSINQKGVETSLIERFLYPKYGPGQMWEEVAQQVEKQGGEIYKHCRVVGIKTDGSNQISEVEIYDQVSGELKKQKTAHLKP